MISEIVSKLKNCEEDIDPEYDPVAPIDLDVERLKSEEYDVPVDVTENHGYWNGFVLGGQPVDLKKGSLETYSWEKCARHWHEFISGRTFLAEDGNILRIRRDQLHLIVTRAIVEPYDTRGRDLRRVKKENMAFFFIDAGVLTSDGRKKASEAFKLKDVAKGKTIYLIWQPEKRSIDQSTGQGTRLRSLTELAILREVPKIEKDIDLILIDGLLFPPAIYIEDALEIYKSLDKEGYRVCAIVKRPGYPVLISHLIDKKLMEVSPDRYASDVPFLRGILKPFCSTGHLWYEPYGKQWRKALPKEWRVLYAYIMVRDKSIFRVEIPIKYQDEWEEIMTFVFSLSEANYGGLPTPLHIADRLCHFSRGERLRIGGLLDSTFSAGGIELSRPYGEAF